MSRLSGCSTMQAIGRLESCRATSGYSQVALAHDGEQSFCRNHFLRSGESMLEHGARADEVHILLRKRVATQIFNERAQPASLHPQPV